MTQATAARRPRAAVLHCPSDGMCTEDAEVRGERRRGVRRGRGGGRETQRKSGMLGMQRHQEVIHIAGDSRAFGYPLFPRGVQRSRPWHARVSPAIRIRQVQMDAVIRSLDLTDLPNEWWICGRGTLSTIRAGHPLIAHPSPPRFFSPRPSASSVYIPPCISLRFSASPASSAYSVFIHPVRTSAPSSAFKRATSASTGAFTSSSRSVFSGWRNRMRNVRLFLPSGIGLPR
jgi:hypothetical protein